MYSYIVIKKQNHKVGIFSCSLNATPKVSVYYEPRTTWTLGY